MKLMLEPLPLVQLLHQASSLLYSKLGLYTHFFFLSRLPSSGAFTFALHCCFKLLNVFLSNASTRGSNVPNPQRNLSSRCKLRRFDKDGAIRIEEPPSSSSPHAVPDLAPHIGGMLASAAHAIGMASLEQSKQSGPVVHALESRDDSDRSTLLPHCGDLGATPAVQIHGQVGSSPCGLAFANAVIDTTGSMPTANCLSVSETIAIRAAKPRQETASVPDSIQTGKAVNFKDLDRAGLTLKQDLVQPALTPMHMGQKSASTAQALPSSATHSQEACLSAHPVQDAKPATQAQSHSSVHRDSHSNLDPRPPGLQLIADQACCLRTSHMLRVDAAAVDAGLVGKRLSGSPSDVTADCEKLATAKHAAEIKTGASSSFLRGIDRDLVDIPLAIRSTVTTARAQLPAASLKEGQDLNCHLVVKELATDASLSLAHHMDSHVNASATMDATLLVKGDSCRARQKSSKTAASNKQQTSEDVPCALKAGAAGPWIGTIAATFAQGSNEMPTPKHVTKPPTSHGGEQYARVCADAAEPGPLPANTDVGRAQQPRTAGWQHSNQSKVSALHIGSHWAAHPVSTKLRTGEASAPPGPQTDAPRPQASQHRGRCLQQPGMPYVGGEAARHAPPPSWDLLDKMDIDNAANHAPAKPLHSVCGLSSGQQPAQPKHTSWAVTDSSRSWLQSRAHTVADGGAGPVQRANAAPASIGRPLQHGSTAPDQQARQQSPSPKLHQATGYDIGLHSLPDEDESPGPGLCAGQNIVPDSIGASALGTWPTPARPSTAVPNRAYHGSRHRHALLLSASPAPRCALWGRTSQDVPSAADVLCAHLPGSQSFSGSPQGPLLGNMLCTFEAFKVDRSPHLNRHHCRCTRLQKEALKIVSPLFIAAHTLSS